jgi:hypothetical protein
MRVTSGAIMRVFVATPNTCFASEEIFDTRATLVRLCWSC